MAEKLQLLLNTLGTIEVKGKENLNHLLASMILLEHIIAELRGKEVDDHGQNSIP